MANIQGLLLVALAILILVYFLLRPRHHEIKGIGRLYSLSDPAVWDELDVLISQAVSGYIRNPPMYPRTYRLVLELGYCLEEGEYEKARWLGGRLVERYSKERSAEDPLRFVGAHAVRQLSADHDLNAAYILKGNEAQIIFEGPALKILDVSSRFTDLLSESVPMNQE